MSLASPVEEEVRVAADGVGLPGTLSLPAGAAGLVLFAHGSGSSRRSPRNARVARTLQRAGLGTLLFDLLTPEEDLDPRARFDIDLLARRLASAAEWAIRRPDAPALPLGLFGASTGAAAALVAAADLGRRVGAVVSRGGRPDLAAQRLHEVLAPTLLIVGGLDSEVILLNRLAYGHLQCPKRLEIVEGATHLFQEKGALDEVAGLASRWFARHLGAAAGQDRSAEAVER